MATQTHNPAEGSLNGSDNGGGAKLRGPNGMVMQERPDPVFVQFSDGETLEGVLLPLEFVMMGEPRKRVARFTVKVPATGELYCFLGTAQLVQKLHVDDVGHWVQIHCEGTDENVRKGENAMKKFRVFVSVDCFPGFAGVSLALNPEITLDDVGF